MSDQPQQGEAPAPVVILVSPQLAQNIGMVSRAMANFGLTELRLVAPKNGWPIKGVREAASGAVAALDGARVYPTLPEAIADLHYVLATTARERGQMKRVMAPDEAMAEVAARTGSSDRQRVGILFGRERVGLHNDEISLADAIITFPVSPSFPSLNLAQAVLLIGYEWRRAAGRATLPFSGEMIAPPATRAALVSLFESVEAALADAKFYPPEKREIIARNMRDMLHRMAMTEQDVRTLRGALRALTRKRGDRAPL